MATHSSTLAWKIPWTKEPAIGANWQAAIHAVAKSWTQLSDFTFTFHFHSLEKEMATHSSVLAWRIPGMRELGGLPSMGSHRVGHNGSSSHNYLIIFHITYDNLAYTLSFYPLICHSIHHKTLIREIEIPSQESSI